MAVVDVQDYPHKMYKLSSAGACVILGEGKTSHLEKVCVLRTSNVTRYPKALLKIQVAESYEGFELLAVNSAKKQRHNIIYQNIKSLVRHFHRSVWICLKTTAIQLSLGTSRF